MKDYKFKLNLWKAYFDTGIGLTNYVKYIIAFFGLASGEVWATLLIASGYAVFCFFLGWFWIRFGFMDAQNEVANTFNPFVKEMLKDKHLKSGRK